MKRKSAPTVTMKKKMTAPVWAVRRRLRSTGAPVRIAGIDSTGRAKSTAGEKRPVAVSAVRTRAGGEPAFVNIW